MRKQKVTTKKELILLSRERNANIYKITYKDGINYYTFDALFLHFWNDDKKANHVREIAKNCAPKDHYEFIVSLY